MALYLAICLSISVVVPFPFSFIALIAKIPFVSYYVGRRQSGRLVYLVLVKGLKVGEISIIVTVH